MLRMTPEVITWVLPISFLARELTKYVVAKGATIKPIE